MIERVLSILNGIPSDKVAHFASGVLLFAAVQWIDPYAAFWVVVLAGTAKEFYDKLHTDIHTPDMYDAIVTALGGAVGMFIKFS